MNFYNVGKPHSSLKVLKKHTLTKFYFGKKVYFKSTKYSPSLDENWE